MKERFDKREGEAGEEDNTSILDVSDISTDLKLLTNPAVIEEKTLA